MEHLQAHPSDTVLAVVGPTASGKSSLALSLAGDLDGEIVSCDSMQIYRGMDIGTAKPTAEEQATVKHHMIDICSPDTEYSCAEYAERAGGAVRDILSRGKLPIFCGGTGLYLDSVLKATRFAPDIPEAVHEAVAQMTPEQAWKLLAEKDPREAMKIHPNNHKRVRRALEIGLGTGKPKSEWDEESRLLPPPFQAEILGLDYRDRQILYDRIDSRVDLMMEKGLLEEARGFFEQTAATAAQAIGYKELFLYFDGSLSLKDAVELLKKNTRNYAKRQLTWFRRTEGVKWIYMDELGEQTPLACALRLLNGFGCERKE